MISVVQAQEIIREHTWSLPEESCSLSEAHGRILRERVTAPEDLPQFDRSAMDGYALRADDSAEEFEVIGEIRAGKTVDHELGTGQAFRIFTGARMPGAGLKVVMQEHVEASEGRIRIAPKGITASNVRLRGEDARAGSGLLEPPHTLNASSVALLASVGKTSVAVSKRPRVFHLSTGDEIVSPEQIPASGQIRNSNASLVAALCRERGVDEVTHVHAPDDRDVLLELVTREKIAPYDLILISGGSGGGAYDFSAELFQHLGATIHFSEVNVRPGKPLIFGTIPKRTVIFGLPGNALSHFVCFHLFVRHALEALLARPTSPVAHGFLAEAMADTANARETWWPAEAILEQGRLECRTLPWKSSGDITRLPAANALMQVPASTSRLDAGTMVHVLLTGDIASRPC